MKYWNIATGELVDPDTPTLGEKFSIAGMDRDLNIQVAGLEEGGLIRQGYKEKGVVKPSDKRVEAGVFALPALGEAIWGLSAAAIGAIASQFDIEPTKEAITGWAKSNPDKMRGVLLSLGIYTSDEPTEGPEVEEDVVDWTPSFKDEKPPKKPKEPKPPDIVKAAAEVVIMENLEKFIKNRSKKASKVKIHEKAKYLDDDWMNAINEITLTKYGGNFEKSADALNLNREQVKGIFHRRGKKLVATGHRLESDLPSGTRTFKEVTTEMKYEPEILRNRYNKLIEEGKIDPKKYYNSKEIANLFDINPSRYHMKEFVQRLKDEGVNFRELTTGPTAIKEYQAEDAVNKMLARMKIKKIAGDPKSTSVRSKLEMEFDPDLTKVLNNIRARTAELAEETGVYIKGKDIGYSGVGEDVGHALSLEVMARYPELFKNSNVRSFQTMVYQDPVINKSILVGEKFQGRQEKIFKELDQYVNKKISKDNIKQINNLGTELKNIHKEIIESINRKAKDNPYFIGQSKRVPEIKLKKFEVGDVFKSKDIFADMSTVDKRFQVGEISKINSKAKNFKDLSKKEQKLYRTNVINQHIENLEKFYRKMDFSPEEIRELKEAFEYGTFTKEPVYKAEGGRVGYQVGGRVDLQAGTMDYPLTNAFTEQKADEISAAELLADAKYMKRDSFDFQDVGVDLPENIGLPFGIRPFEDVLRNELRAKTEEEHMGDVEKARAAEIEKEDYLKEGFKEKGTLQTYADVLNPKNIPYYVAAFQEGISEGTEWGYGQAVKMAEPGYFKKGKELKDYFYETKMDKMKIPGLGQSLEEITADYRAKAAAEGMSPEVAKAAGWVKLGGDLVMPLFAGMYGASVAGTRFLQKVPKFLGNTKIAKDIEKMASDRMSAFNKGNKSLTSFGEGRRDFNRLLAGSSFIGMFKILGLDKLFKFTPAVDKTGTMIKVLKDTTSEMPDWFPAFVAKLNSEGKLKYEGDGMWSMVDDAELPGITVYKEGENYTVIGKNEYEQEWIAHYEAPHWLEPKDGKDAVKFKGDFEVKDNTPYTSGPEGDFDVELETLRGIDHILGGNAKTLEEWTTSIQKKEMTIGEAKVSDAELRFQQQADMLKEEGSFAEGGLASLVKYGNNR